jgi:hypothetical protein
VTQLEHQVRKAQRRLWLNRWLNQLAWTVTMAAFLYALVVLVQRLYDAPIPLMWVGLGFGGAALAASIAWSLATREGARHAATVLDAAAGLRERISSGLYCQTSRDPFARAVVADAESISRGLSVRTHLRLSVPRPLGWAGIAVVVAALMFLITPGVLQTGEASQVREAEQQVEQTQAVVKKKLGDIQKMAMTNPAMDDLKADLLELGKEPIGKLSDPSDIRHQAVKKIDKLQDAIKKKRQDSKYDSVSEMRKMMRALKPPDDSKSPTKKLSQALAQGDFKKAKEEIAKVREQLATLKSEQDKKMAERLSKELDELAKQLERAAQNKQLAEKLEQAGISKEDIERMLENLKKKDIDQLKKQLQEKGLTQQQAEKLAKQLQQRQQAGSMAQQLAQAMKQASKCNNPGQVGDAMDGLSQAGQQLSDVEQMQQEMDQLDSMMSDLQDAKDDLDKPCPDCNGTGTKDGKT